MEKTEKIGKTPRAVEPPQWTQHYKLYKRSDNIEGIKGLVHKVSEGRKEDHEYQFIFPSVENFT